MFKEKFTIKDIAMIAGVSKGTVDRVLHKRGKVSKTSLEKVDQVLKKIDYKPNPIARSLKNNKIYSIYVLLPDPCIDSYWIPADEGIVMAANQFNHFGIQIKKYYYDPTDTSSFLEQAQQAIRTCPDVLLIAPIFEKESQDVLKKCCENKIMVVMFNNLIDSSKDYLFIGQDLTQSGRVAASLMEKIIGIDDRIAIIHINMEPHMQLKENGFKDFFKERIGNSNTMISKNFEVADRSSFAKDVSKFLKDTPKISGIFVTNSKAFMLVEAIQKLDNKDFVIIGYDLLDENMWYLREGKIDFLIHQNPKKQIYLSISHLADHFIFGKTLPREELLPIDVITTENAHYHL